MSGLRQINCHQSFKSKTQDRRKPEGCLRPIKLEEESGAGLPLGWYALPCGVMVYKPDLI